MFRLIRDAVRAIWRAFAAPRQLAAENVALRHQLGVVLRPTRSRPRLKLAIRDRILWVWLSRIWSGWKDCVRIVQPETVIAWHRRGWGLYWTWKSKRGKPGRPPVPQDVRELIRTISSQNVTWCRLSLPWTPRSHEHGPPGRVT